LVVAEANVGGVRLTAPDRRPCYSEALTAIESANWRLLAVS